MSQTRPLFVRHQEGEVLRPLGTHMRFVCPGASTARAWSLSEVEVPRDSGPPPHHHPWDEAYYILDGVIEFSLNGESIRAETGDFVYIPCDILHGFQGASESPARTLIFDAPAASEPFFRELDHEVKNIPDDLPKVPEIGLKHGLHF